MTVLIVDDDRDVCEVVACTLQRAHFSVLKASSGFEAISLWESHKERIDLLVTDIAMPGMSGLTLARYLRTFGLSTPVLFMSGHWQPELDEYPGTSFVAKPFMADALLSAIRRLDVGSRCFGAVEC
jgi:CheY-like chemotaxis protein